MRGRSPRDRLPATTWCRTRSERAWSKFHLYRRGTDLRALAVYGDAQRIRQPLRDDTPAAPLDDEMPELAQPARNRTRWCCATWMRRSGACRRTSARSCLLVALENELRRGAGALGIPIGTVIRAGACAGRSCATMLSGCRPRAATIEDREMNDG